MPDDPVQLLLDRLVGVRTLGSEKWSARCPAHDDKHASLSVARGDDGRALIHCHAGCSPTEVCKAAGLRLGQLFIKKENTTRAGAEAGGGRVVKTYDYLDEAGTLLFQVVRFHPKAFRQRRPDGKGGWVWKLDGVHRVLYRLPELIHAPVNETIFIVEGEKDADGLVALGLLATTCPQGAGKWGKLDDDSVLVGRHVVILPDKDEPGRQHAREVASRLQGRAASCRVVELPERTPGQKDASDFIAAGATAEDFRQLASTRPPIPSMPPSPPTAPTSAVPEAPKPKIIIDTNEHRVVCETIDALRSDAGVFQRGGLLVRIVRDVLPDDGIRRMTGSPSIQILPVANLRERLTRAAAFVKIRREEEVPAHPTPWLVSAIDARHDWPGIRPLQAVSDAPILRPDGTVWQTPGYDPMTGVVFDPAEGAVFPAIHPEVSLDDAVEAREQLLDLVGDFTFLKEEHKAAWLAGLLTPLARFAFEGPTPLFLIDANVRGAGKGLLAQTIGWIVTGREMPVGSYSADPEEMRKKITSIAISADRMINLDNIEGVFGNDALDRALTTTRWRDRVLGKSQDIILPLTPCWYATGNNVQVAADTARRVIHIRLDVLDERPENRQGFRHPNLLTYISARRPQLLAHALTILAAYCRNGRPKHNLIPFGSFEGWSSFVREAVVWSGMPDPCLTRALLAESSDTVHDTLQQLIAAWRLYDEHNIGIVVGELLARLYPMERQYAPQDAGAAAMRAALENLCGCPPGRVPTARQVGNRLRQFRRRVVGSVYVDIDPNDSGRAGQKWRLYGRA